ncbi:hypothetical protein K7432_007073 [Basidiobolus ranarum]|uniref:RRM domain-containing protein n=1 Tax=Basidiobolus ranarum TaxID=34480 RepID=A0ABR2W0M2_9FUNG
MAQSTRGHSQVAATECSPQNENSALTESMTKLTISTQLSRTSSPNVSVYTENKYEGNHFGEQLEFPGTPTTDSDPGLASPKSLVSASSNSTAHSIKRASPQGCIFVASLAASKTDEELHESVTKHFSKYGKLLNVKVLKDWKQRPYSFVQFENVHDAKRALTEAHHTILDGRHIRVEQARVNRTLFIAKISRSLNEEELRNILEEYGPLEDLTILQNYQTGRSKGCGFVKFCYRDDAIRAYSELRVNSKWVVEWAPNLERGSGQVDRTSVFIGQLNQKLVTQSLLEEKFGKYGKIELLNLVNRNANMPAFAFIKYSNEDAAGKAIENENGSRWLETTIRVQYRESNEGRVHKQLRPNNYFTKLYPGSSIRGAVPFSPPHYEHRPSVATSTEATGYPYYIYLGNVVDGNAYPQMHMYESGQSPPGTNPPIFPNVSSNGEQVPNPYMFGDPNQPNYPSYASFSNPNNQPSTRSPPPTAPAASGGSMQQSMTSNIPPSSWVPYPGTYYAFPMSAVPTPGPYPVAYMPIPISDPQYQQHYLPKGHIAGQAPQAQNGGSQQAGSSEYSHGTHQMYHPYNGDFNGGGDRKERLKHAE